MELIKTVKELLAKVDTLQKRVDSISAKIAEETACAVNRETADNEATNEA